MPRRRHGRLHHQADPPRRRSTKRSAVGSRRPTPPKRTSRDRDGSRRPGRSSIPTASRCCAISTPATATCSRRIVSEYLNDGAQLLAALREALAEGDPHTVERTAHTLKGSSANLGAVARRRDQRPPRSARPGRRARDRAPARRRRRQRHSNEVRSGPRRRSRGDLNAGPRRRRRIHHPAGRQSRRAEARPRMPRRRTTATGPGTLLQRDTHRRAHHRLDDARPRRARTLPAHTRPTRRQYAYTYIDPGHRA